MEYLSIANSPFMWLACAPTVAIVMIQVVLFTKRSLIVADKAGISRKDCFKAFRTGVITAIGPSIATTIILVGMISSLGAPISWLRLSIVGSGTKEITMAGVGASAVGQALGEPGFNLHGYSAAVWAMSLATFCWVVDAFFIPRGQALQKVVNKRDKNMMLVVSVSSMAGILSYLCVNTIKTQWDLLIAGLVSGITILLLEKTVKKFPKLREYHAGIAMLMGVFAAVLFTSLKT